MSKLSFISFRVEYYAIRIGKAGDKMYKIFKREKVLDLLENNYEHLTARAWNT